jgi:hypothetical protein
MAAGRQCHIATVIAPSPIGWPFLAPVESALLREIVTLGN